MSNDNTQAESDDKSSTGKWTEEDCKPMIQDIQKDSQELVDVIERGNITLAVLNGRVIYDASK